MRNGTGVVNLLELVMMWVLVMVIIMLLVSLIVLYLYFMLK